LLNWGAQLPTRGLSRIPNIDTSHFSGKWLFDQIIESVRSTIKYIGALVDVMKKLVKGDFSGAWDSMVDAAKILADSPVAKGVTKVAVGLADKAVDAARKYLPEWMGVNQQNQRLNQNSTRSPLKSPTGHAEQDAGRFPPGCSEKPSGTQRRLICCQHLAGPYFAGHSATS
jgi:hypothetical protein